MRECQSCAARPSEADLPRPKPGMPLLCTGCVSGTGKLPHPAADRPHRIIRRARYRAALRHREASPQGDLVDLIVRAP